MIYSERASRRLSISGFAGPGAATAALPSARKNLDEAIGIDVDAPARAARQAEALARIRKREAAIFRALGDSPAQPAWSEIAIEHSAVRPPVLAAASGALSREARPAAHPGQPAVVRRLRVVAASPDETPQPRPAPATSRVSGDFTSALFPDLVAVFPSLTFGFVTGLLACSILGWLAVWVVLRFCR